MSFRGRGRGRSGFGGGGFRSSKSLPYKLFPEIDGLGKADYSKEIANVQLIKWSSSLQAFWSSSPYFYEDRSKRAEKVQKTDIERYSDRNLETAKAKPPLWHFINLDADHFPAELARGEKKETHVVKKVRWNPESDSKKMDLLEKFEEKNKGDGMEKKEIEDEEEEDAENEEDEEFSDDGDYEQGEYFDDDEDDCNMADDNDEAFYD